jgi:transposase
MKYSYEKKLAVVVSVVSGQESVSSAARHLGTSHKHVRRWVALYEHYGKEGLRIKNGYYSEEFKLSVIRDMEKNHLSLFQTAVKFGIPGDSTVLQWYRIYQAEGLSERCRDNRGRMKKQGEKTHLSNSTRDASALDKELERLRAENAYLKKLRVLVEERIVRESGNEQEPSTN